MSILSAFYEARYAPPENYEHIVLCDINGTLMHTDKITHASVPDTGVVGLLAYLKSNGNTIQLVSRIQDNAQAPAILVNAFSQVNAKMHYQDKTYGVLIDDMPATSGINALVTLNVTEPRIKKFLSQYAGRGMRFLNNLPR